MKYELQYNLPWDTKVQHDIRAESNRAALYATGNKDTLQFCVRNCNNVSPSPRVSLIELGVCSMMAVGGCCKIVEFWKVLDFQGGA